MLTFPNIDPIALQLGPVAIRWYGIMYLVAFAAAWYLGRKRARSHADGWQDQQVEDLIFYSAMGVVLGGRVGYVFFYNFDRFLADPLWLFKITEGGMSFHGGMLGVCVAFLYMGYKTQRNFLQIADFAAPLVPIGLGVGRLGNFIGGELWGRAASSDVPWAMVFPHVDKLPRHPSQIYQALLEGFSLFILVWFFSKKPRPTGAITGLFGAGYGSFRFFVEFFRQPDEHLGYVAFGWMTKGQLLSLPMIVIGVALMVLAYKGFFNKKA